MAPSTASHRRQLRQPYNQPLSWLSGGAHTWHEQQHHADSMLDSRSNPPWKKTNPPWMLCGSRLHHHLTRPAAPAGPQLPSLPRPAPPPSDLKRVGARQGSGRVKCTDRVQSHSQVCRPSTSLVRLLALFRRRTPTRCASTSKASLPTASRPHVVPFGS